MKYLLPILLGTLTLFACSEKPAEIPDPEEDGYPPEEIELAGLNKERGLLVKTEETTPGYVMFTSLVGGDTYLIDKDGQVVHVWESELGAGAEYLMPDGRMIRHARDPEAPVFAGGGMSGRFLEFDWEGNLTWDFKLATENEIAHHDFSVMPNGNILAIVWEKKSPEEALAAGRTAHTIPKAGLWPDKIVEIEPVRPDSGRIVWSWHTWDHMIQEVDPSRSNYGRIAGSPRKININNLDSLWKITPEEVEKIQNSKDASPNFSADNRGSDMFHTNAIDYNADFDQVIVSTPDYNEIWVIDHSLSTEEARTSKGDLLYRWGNPQSYNRGDSTLKILGGQHDIRWIPEGYPGAGNLTVFNNVTATAEGKPYSQVLELALPFEKGEFTMTDSMFTPAAVEWSFIAPDTTSFFAPFISSAHRMKNGNTFVNSGPQGRLMEVTPDGQIVWEYWSPYIGDTRLDGDKFPQPVGPFQYAVFRATHIPVDHPALEGKELSPLDPQPPVQKAE